MSNTVQSGADKAKAVAPPPTFLTFLSQVDEGRLASNATEELEVLVRELRALAAIVGIKPKGKIRIEMSIEALANGLMNVSGDIKLTMPRRPKSTSTFWTTKENCLSAVNPSQLAIPGIDVVTNGGRAGVRVVD